jgi:NAD(P)H-dependent FMN reductase
MSQVTHILILDGSLGARGGNTDAALQHLLANLSEACVTEVVRLATDPRGSDELEPLLARANGFVFATGTYWDSWGSPLQRFLEQTTHLEASDIWLGKPAAVVVTMHSVGGKGVLSRLQGVLSTLGLLIPPMTGCVYSLACHLVLSEALARDAEADFWQPDDFGVIAHNLLEATIGGRNWKTWAVDRGRPERRWMPDAAVSTK